MTTISEINAVRELDGYEAFALWLRQGFAASQLRHGNSDAPAAYFTTDASGLWDAYLLNLPEEGRQHYNCRACRAFFEKFGGLVTIDASGGTHPAMWEGADPDVVPEKRVPPFFSAAVAALHRAVHRARVTGVFLSSETTWGRPVTGEWVHLHARQNRPTPAPIVQTLDQVMAEKHEDRGMLLRGLAEFPPSTLRAAKSLLETEALYRSEKVLGVATWLLDLQDRLEGAKGPTWDNLAWAAVASAPPGFCHVRSTMIGTLLEDLASGMPFERVSARFAEKMHPLQYQRPQSAPSAGNIKQAEDVVSKLGAAGALDRRFARIEEVLPHAVWTPKPEAEVPKAEGVFGHLLPGDKELKIVSSMAPAQTMTWEKFARTVLPTAERVEVLVPSAGPFCPLTTAANPDAPPILQWDSVEARNPVAWYFHSGGSSAIQFNLRAGSWARVSAITLKPSQWGEKPLDHMGRGIHILIEDCRDARPGEGNMIFPETLRSEFHAVRKTIEAYSHKAKIGGVGEPAAAGLAYNSGKGHPGLVENWGVTLRATSRGVVTAYKLDRWD